jgi:hypothetical protein
VLSKIPSEPTTGAGVLPPETFARWLLTPAEAL